MILIVLGAVALTVMLFESRFLFYPEREHALRPNAMGLPYEDVQVTTSDGVKLHGWFLPHPAPRATVLFFHGNAGNISHRLPKARLLRDLGLHVFLLDYRGYGASEGRVTETGLYRDARAAHAALCSRADVESSRIVCFGESLGGAVAIELATRVPCRALIVESSFTSIPDLAGDLFFPGVRYLVSARFDSLSRLPHLRVPILFIHGRDDDLIPFKHAERLLEAAHPPKELYAVPGAGHNDVYVVAGSRWAARIDGFLREALRLPVPAR
jgi:hypothetical protein